jgi:cobalamin biosynthesis protein CobD/CbiB
MSALVPSVGALVLALTLDSLVGELPNRAHPVA